MALELERIPQLGEMLVRENIISADSKKQIDDTLLALRAEGKSPFTGDIAVELGIIDERNGRPITKETINQTLLEQVVSKAEAAVKDINTIAGDQTTRPTPPWLKANWGNNGVNPAPADPSREDGIASAANIAQNLVMLANRKPELATDSTIKVVSAAASLARGIEGSDPKKAPLDQAGEWMETVERGLRDAVAKSGAPLKDNWGGQEINIDDYIKERFKEIEAGIAKEVARQAEPERNRVRG